MGEARSRVYRGGVLESEDFPVAEVSEYLEQPDTMVWVDFCGPTEEQLDELADELGLHELAVEDALGPHQRPKLDHYATHRFLSCHAVTVDPRSRRARRVRDRRVRQQPLDHHGAQGRRLLDGSGAAALGPFPRSRSPGRQLLALRPARRRRRRLLRRRPIVRRLLRRGQRRDLLRTAARRGAATPLVRDAPRAGPLPPSRRTHARGGQRAHAARAQHRSPKPSTRTTRTSTTTSCASANPPTRCGTSSAPSSRPTSASATTARTRS